MLNILDFLKRRKKPIIEEETTLSWLKIDMHSHLIPGIDDGSKSMEESISLLQEMSDLGLEKVITTPHIMSEYYKNTPEIILSGLHELRKEAESRGLSIKIDAAAEYYVDDIFLDKVKAGEKLLTFGENYVLIETGFINKPQVLLETIFQLEMAGYKPILAHPERYQYLSMDKKLQSEILDRNILLQVNLLSLTGFYSKPVKDFAERLIDTGNVKFLGSDCHNPRYMEVLKTLSKHQYYSRIKEIPWYNSRL